MPNRLQDSHSAYLKQHQNNPVHWWPFCSEAIEQAQKLNRPIFLSIGYSSCHWCHVLAHESFEDQTTADFLNQNFINIKVDREEHPDLDDYYQRACQLFIRAGGWPLSAFLLPDMRPFFVATYFPKVAKAGQSSFMEVLKELSRAYREDHDQVETNAQNATKAIANTEKEDKKIPFKGHFPHPQNILKALEAYRDCQNGGHGEAPKFPHFAFLEWGIENLLEGVIEKAEGEHFIKTLEHMLLGGIYDHARGGLHRYSTDECYKIPHFEKMLYDQAGLLKVLAKASIVYPAPSLIEGLDQTLDYLKTEMKSEKNYFFSAQDADSEDVEGLYFTFKKEEFDKCVAQLPSTHKIGENWFEMSKEGNFENGLNAIYLLPQFKDEFYQEQNWKQIRHLREILLKERQSRIPPLTDTKGVASWNFMLVSALADVIQYGKIPSIKNKAFELLHTSIEGIFKNFIQKIPDTPDNVCIVHTTTQKSSLPYAEDHITFADMNFRVYEITGNANFLKNAFDTIEFIFKEFYDEQKGNLYTRAIKSSDEAPYPNIPLSTQGSSFRSVVAMFVTLVRRAGLVRGNDEWSRQLGPLVEKLKHATLSYPLAHGEALRALTYPDEVYRLIKIPPKWPNNSTFLNFMAHLPNRFVFSYHGPNSPDAEQENWQVCTLRECSKQGVGLESFVQALRPPIERKEGKETDSANPQ